MVFIDFFRYTPSLIAFVIFCGTLLPYITNGPEYQIFLERHYETCQKYWWATLLYMHNYIFSNDMVSNVIGLGCIIKHNNICNCF